MEANWHRAAGAIFGTTSKPGTVSLFYDYDLLAWTFGLRFEIDECWYGISFEAGPIRLSLDYWRHYVDALSGGA